VRFFSSGGHALAHTGIGLIKQYKKAKFISIYKNVEILNRRAQKT
jgi:hypothetical protein